MKKILLTICSISLAISQLFAQNNSMNRQKTYDSSVDDSDLFKKDDSAFLFNAEFLYWTVEEGSLDYAITMQNPNSVSDTYAQGNYNIAKYDWKPGFRVLFGYFNAPKYWELKGQYAWIRSTGSDIATKPSNTSLLLNGTFPELGAGTLNSATSSIKLNYDLGDLLAARFFNPNPHLRIRMLGGATIARIHQTWNVQYLGTASIVDINDSWNFFGGGLRLGMDIDWFLGKDFYLTGEASTAALIGRYKNRSKNSQSTDIYKNSFYKDYRVAFSTQFLLGPSYQRSFACCRFEIFAGYELTSWFNLQEIYRSSHGTSGAKETYINDGILSLQGLTTRFTFNY